MTKPKWNNHGNGGNSYKDGGDVNNDTIPGQVQIVHQSEDSKLRVEANNDNAHDINDIIRGESWPRLKQQT